MSTALTPDDRNLLVPVAEPSRAVATAARAPTRRRCRPGDGPAGERLAFPTTCLSTRWTTATPTRGCLFCAAPLVSLRSATCTSGAFCMVMALHNLHSCHQIVTWYLAHGRPRHVARGSEQIGSLPRWTEETIYYSQKKKKQFIQKNSRKKWMESIRVDTAGGTGWNGSDSSLLFLLAFHGIDWPLAVRNPLDQFDSELALKSLILSELNPAGPPLSDGRR